MRSAPIGRTSLGRFALIHRLAVGGMGEIFLARERGAAGFERLVVVKTLLADPDERAGALTLFLDEARIAAHLSHPNLVQVHELGEDDGEYFIAMEFVASQHLGRVIGRLAKDKARLPLPIAGYIALEATRGLAYAHQARDADGKALEIVHRDVSPSNILVGYRGEVKVADFGIAKAANRESRTQTGKVRGKLSYMSPEQLRGHSVDPRCDVWAMGVVLWEACLGRRLFHADTDVETIRQVLEASIAPPTSIDPAFPPSLEAVILGALARDADRRTRSADDLAASLRDALRSGPGLADASDVAELMRARFTDEQRELDVLVGGVEDDTARASPRAVTKETRRVADEHSPAPGDARSPAPGDARSPAPGDARSPAPGDARSPAPGDARSPAPGDARSPAHGSPRSPAQGNPLPPAQGHPRSPAQGSRLVPALGVVLALGLVALAAVVILRRDSSPARTLSVDAGAVAVSPLPPDTAPNLADANTVDGSRATADPVVPTDAGAVKNTLKPRRDAGVPPARLPADAAPTVTPPAKIDAAPPAPAGKVELRVQASGGRIVVDDRRFDSDHLRTHVTPGRHHVVVTLDDGATADTWFDGKDGALVKCVLSGATLSCASS